MKALIYTLILTFAVLVTPGKAEAQELLGPGCVQLQHSGLPIYGLMNSESNMKIQRSGLLAGPSLKKLSVSAGMCERLEIAQDAWDVISIGVVPLVAAMQIPSVKASLATSAAAVAASVGSAPVVAAVTITGAVGAGVAWVVLRATMQDCKAKSKDRLKREILEELADKHGIYAKNIDGIGLNLK
jgi:hypothetical protein